MHGWKRMLVDAGMCCETTFSSDWCLQDMRTHAKYAFGTHAPFIPVKKMVELDAVTASTRVRGLRAQDVRHEPVISRFVCVSEAYFSKSEDLKTRVGKLPQGALIAAVEISQINTASLESQSLPSTKDKTMRVRALMPPTYTDYGWVSTRTKDGKLILKPTKAYAQFNDLHPTGCAGWLEKKRTDAGGLLSGSWNRRWFVCKGTHLRKFETNVNGEGVDAIGATVDLTAVHEVRPSINAKATQFEFELITTNRIVRLRAPNEYEMRSWIDALQRQSYTNELTPDSENPAPSESPAARSSTVKKLDSKSKVHQRPINSRVAARATTLQVKVLPGWTPGQIVPVHDPTTGRIVHIQLPPNAYVGALLHFNTDGSTVPTPDI
eukprot:SAG31_NODE_7382_length_1704_cov_1.345171_2_plen_379_part_00